MLTMVTVKGYGHDLLSPVFTYSTYLAVSCKPLILSRTHLDAPMPWMAQIKTRDIHRHKHPETLVFFRVISTT